MQKNGRRGVILQDGCSNCSFSSFLWFVVAIYLIPSLLRRVRRLLNAETLLVISLGLCLGMVVLANSVGFSSALGAFVMGSVLAGTSEAKAIEKVMAPVKDLFGAVFFVSVGMLVEPPLLVAVYRDRSCCLPSW